MGIHEGRYAIFAELLTIKYVPLLRRPQLNSEDRGRIDWAGCALGKKNIEREYEVNQGNDLQQNIPTRLIQIVQACDGKHYDAGPR